MWTLVRNYATTSMKFSGLLVLLCLQQALGWVSYEGYKAYTVVPKNRFEADILHSLETNPKYDFWAPPRMLNVPATVMVAPDEQSKFERTMNARNINMSVLIKNVEDTVKPLQSSSVNVAPGDVTFEEYMSVEGINAYLLSLAERYPNYVILEELGNSYEGRELIAIRITTGPPNSGKPTIFVDAGIHAREWVAPPAALYIINQLVENSINLPMFQDIDWVVLPVVNPDGYNYSRIYDTMWRKTRSITANPICPGVDGNRNFDYYWMEIGASASPCAETFAGNQPTSEPEVEAVSNYLISHKGLIKLYITFHSYGRYILYPWGYSYHLPSNNEELYNLGYAASNAIANFSFGSLPYQVGSSSNLLYPAAGGSDDFAMGPGGVDLAYTIELPEGGNSGFHPPNSRILPIVQETFEGIKVLQKYVQDKYVV